MPDKYDHLIDGELVPPSTDEYFESLDPATESPIGLVAKGSKEDIDKAVKAATNSLDGWQETTPSRRGQILHDVADRIRSNKEELSKLETRDQGKPLSQSKEIIELGARFFEYYSGAADKLEGKSIPINHNNFDFITREPYGVSAQITPWNFPFSIACRGIAPALAAGNTVVLKPAPTTPLISVKLVELCLETDLPAGAVNIVTGGAEPGRALSNHDDVDVITFTGSLDTGRSVMEAAAETITPVTLELGGNNPAVVLPDADLDEAIREIASGIFTNAGQVCSAADRAIVHESVYDDFVKGIVSEAESYQIGPGMEDTDIGPLNNRSQYDKVMESIRVGKEEAVLETGGEALARDGFFIQPTVFSDVSNNMVVSQGEIFGPVLTVTPFTGTAEAVRIANDTKYGLTGGVFSTNIKDALTIARDIDAGSIGINEWYGGGIQTPFGGMKSSGIGREKSLEGLNTYLQSKNISITLS